MLLLLDIAFGQYYPPPPPPADEIVCRGGSFMVYNEGHTPVPPYVTCTSAVLELNTVAKLLNTPAALGCSEKPQRYNTPVPFTGPATESGRRQAAAALNRIATFADESIGNFTVREDAITSDAVGSDCSIMANRLDNAVHRCCAYRPCCDQGGTNFSSCCPPPTPPPTQIPPSYPACKLDGTTWKDRDNATVAYTMTSAASRGGGFSIFGYCREATGELNGYHASMVDFNSYYPAPPEPTCPNPVSMIISGDFAEDCNSLVFENGWTWYKSGTPRPPPSLLPPIAPVTKPATITP